MTDNSRNMREAGIVNRYLAYLERRGFTRRRDPERLELRLMQVKQLLEGDSLTPVQRIDLIQERINLQADVADLDTNIEHEFQQIIKGWAERRAVSYAALREAGVPANVLREAGMSAHDS